MSRPIRTGLETRVAMRPIIGSGSIAGITSRIVHRDRMLGLGAGGPDEPAPGAEGPGDLGCRMRRAEAILATPGEPLGGRFVAEFLLVAVDDAVGGSRGPSFVPFVRSADGLFRWVHRRPGRPARHRPITQFAAPRTLHFGPDLAAADAPDPLGGHATRCEKPPRL